MTSPLISTANLCPRHHNQMPLISNRKVDSLSADFNVTHNHSFLKHPASNIPSKDLSMGTPLSSNSEAYDDQNMYDILSDQDIFSMALNHETMWNGTIQNHGFMTASHKPCIDTALFQSHPFDMPIQKSVKSITKEVIHQPQGQEVIKNNKRVHMRRTQISKENNPIRRRWTPDEDSILEKWVEKNGPKYWFHIAKRLNGRVGKQCRERWYSRLNPKIKKNPWSEEEYHILIQAEKKYGNQWTKIAKFLPGRTETVIRNLWNATKRREHSRKWTKGNYKNSTLSLGNILEKYTWSNTVDTKNLVNAKSVAPTANTNLGVLNFSNYNNSNVEWINELNDNHDGNANANAKADDNDEDGKCDDDWLINMDLTEFTTPFVDDSTTLMNVPTQPSPPAWSPLSSDDDIEFDKLIDELWMDMPDGLIF